MVVEVLHKVLLLQQVVQVQVQVLLQITVVVETLLMDTEEQE